MAGLTITGNGSRTGCGEVTIWSSTSEGIDSIMEGLRDEARGYVDDVIRAYEADAPARAAASAVGYPGAMGTLVDAAVSTGEEYGLGLTGDLLEHAAKRADEPTAESLTEAIDDADWTDLGESFIEGIAAENEDDRACEADYLRLPEAKLDRPVIMLASAGLWDGPRHMAFIHEFRFLGDIIAESPCNGMASEEYLLTDDGELEYRGYHHDGVNTVDYRLLREGADADELRRVLERGDDDAIDSYTEPLRPYVMAAWGRTDK